MSWQDDRRHAVFDPNALGRLQWILDEWAAQGVTPVALPWQAPEACIAHTRPDMQGRADPATHEGLLLASGEQAFLWLDDQGELPASPQGYIGWTPCFRHEPRYDGLHHHYFLKAELFIPLNGGDALRALERLVDRVDESWQRCAQVEGRPEVDLVREVTGALSQDLVLGDVELGSYGVRERMNGRGPYLYGTALAEPRWSRTWPSASCD